MTGPLISVVVPFHNNEDLLGNCLRSIAAQTLDDIEVIMMDDGSADGGAAAGSMPGPAGGRMPRERPGVLLTLWSLRVGGCYIWIPSERGGPAGTDHGLGTSARPGGPTAITTARRGAA